MNHQSFVVLSVHHPKPGKEALLVESMHRYGEESRKHKGLQSVFTLKDQKGSELVGIAIWDSEESYLAARPDLMKAVEGDDFDSWEESPMKGYRLRPV